MVLYIYEYLKSVMDLSYHKDVSKEDWTLRSTKMAKPPPALKSNLDLTTNQNFKFDSIAYYKDQ